MTIHGVLKITVVCLSLAVFQVSLPPALSAMTGVCVDAPGIPCNGSSSGGGGYNVDPDYRARIREQRRLEREERQQKQEARRKYRTPYRGIEKLQKRVKQEIGKSLIRLDKSGASVQYTTGRISADQAAILVPDQELGSLLLVRPIHPVKQETKVASEQLRKVKAVLGTLDANTLSAEESHFLAAQAAAMMTGGPSYVHVTLSEAGTVAAVETLEQVNRDLATIADDRRAIAHIEAERESVLTQAKDEIKKYVALSQKLQETAGAEHAEISRQLQQSEATMNTCEKEYFGLQAREALIRNRIKDAAMKMKETIIWKK